MVQKVIIMHNREVSRGPRSAAASKTAPIPCTRLTSALNTAVRKDRGATKITGEYFKSLKRGLQTSFRRL